MQKYLAAARLAYFGILKKHGKRGIKNLARHPRLLKHSPESVIRKSLPEFLPIKP
jgi:hypothetical protein